MNIALCQLSPAPRDIGANVERACAVLAEHSEADTAIFPERFLSGYQVEDLSELAVQADGRQLGAVRNAAAQAGTTVIIGFAEALTGGVANSAACIGRDGSLAGVYRKTHLFGDEAGAFIAGDRLEPIELDGTRCGVMICFDVEFPEVARTLALRGADTLVTVSANMEPFGPDHDLAVRARAMENGVPHVYTNRVGEEIGERFVGHSTVVDHNGHAVASARDTETILTCRICTGHGRRDARTEYLRQLRPELYELS